MKKTTFTLLLSLSCCWLAAQCPPYITFSTQGQIDSFQINYPNCSEIDSNVIISGSDIVRLDSLYSLKKIGGQLRIEYTGLSDLTGLNNLDSVKGCLRILENSVLVGLVGLENLKYVGRAGEDDNEWGLEISGNPLLTSLQGPEILTAVGGCLDVGSNLSLASLNGLGSLASIGNCKEGFFEITYRSISIYSNPALSSLTGLNNIDTVQSDVEIRFNPALKSLDGLNKLHVIGRSLSIYYNDSLATLEGLENLEFVGVKGCLYITGNPSLTTLNALSHLRRVGACPVTDTKQWNLVVRENDQLTSLAGLDSIQFPGYGEMHINDCPMLATCDVHSICNYLENGGKSFISDNAPGCNEAAEIELACLVSTGEAFSAAPPLQIFPNPAGDFLQIQANDNEKWEISLYDLRGRQMFRQLVSGSQTIGLEDWPSGIYTLRAVSGERVFAGKIVKQ